MQTQILLPTFTTPGAFTCTRTVTVHTAGEFASNATSAEAEVSGFPEGWTNVIVGPPGPQFPGHTVPRTGHVVFTAGQLVGPEGQIVGRTGHWLAMIGQTVGTGRGQAVTLSGHTVFCNGHIVFDAGQRVLSGGQVVADGGHWVAY
jgi:hypothetical protein